MIKVKVRVRGTIMVNSTHPILTTNGSESDEMLTSAEMTAFELKRRSIISAAAKATARCNDLTQKRSHRRHPPTLYVQGDLVLIRCTNVRHKVVRKNYVTKGKIIACNYNLHRYKVRFDHPNKPIDVFALPSGFLYRSSLA